ncbi:MAG: TIGR00266 family protein [Bacteriovoracaceae bacterium]
MEVKIEGGQAFSHLNVTLSPGESITTESGAMASMDKGVDLKSSLNGGIFRAILLKLLGKESLFINNFSNTTKEAQKIYLTQRSPGEICEAQINDETLYIQPGAFIACSKGVKFSLRWAGFSSWLAGEGLFRIKIHGTGKVWYGAYGAVVEKYVEGEYIVDSGHLLSYPEDMELKIKLAGGIFSSFFSGEGLVLKLVGKGKIKLQTRSIGGLAGWLNPRFWN